MLPDLLGMAFDTHYRVYVFWVGFEAICSRCGWLTVWDDLTGWWMPLMNT